MRRSALHPGLTLVLALGLSGSEAVLAQDPQPQVIRGRAVEPTRTGVVDVEKAAARDRIRAADGLDRYSHTPIGPPEPVKGFPFPDRGSQALYFTTTTRVQSAVDNGAGSFLPKWNAQVGLTSPWPVLFWAAQNKLYVGIESWGGPSGAWLYDMSAATGGVTTIRLEIGTPTAIGAPSLDTGVTPVMLHAGSVAGVIYAVQVP